jgi:adenylate cyclase
MDMYLELAGSAEPRRFPLRAGDHVIGRSPHVDIHVGERSLSRRHAVVSVTGDLASIRDLDSRNGTRVNGVPVVGQVSLSVGDDLRCGDVRFAVGSAAPSPSMLPQRVLQMSSDPARTMMFGVAPVKDVDPMAQRFAVLLRVGELLAQPDADRQLGSRILALAAEILPIDRAVLLTVDQEDRVQIAASLLSDGAAERPYSESIVHYVLEHRVAVQFDDAQADERLGAAASLVMQSIRCAMCAPLIVNDALLGVLYVDNRLTTHSFDPSDLELLVGFANQAAMALHNAALQDQVKAAAVRQHTFERFFPPATAARLLESGGDLGVQELFVTALFSDISAFTEMSATMAPADVVALLHVYFPPMARIVFDKDGTLEKYIGDALMAVWGAPFSHPDDADRALEAAVEMHEAVLRMREQLPRPIDVHIGLHSGVVALANIGSAEYLQVATIGDATNTSARVCSVAGDGELVITRQTAERLTRSTWPLTALPPTRVKGKAEPLELYRVEWRRG